MKAINREDIVNASIYNVEPVNDVSEKELAQQQLDQSGSFQLDNSGCDSLNLDQSGFDSLKDELGTPRDSSLGRSLKKGRGVKVRLRIRFTLCYVIKLLFLLKIRFMNTLNAKNLKILPTIKKMHSLPESNFWMPICYSALFFKTLNGV